MMAMEQGINNRWYSFFTRDGEKLVRFVRSQTRRISVIGHINRATGVSGKELLNRQADNRLVNIGRRAGDSPLNCCRESDANRTRPLMLRLVKEQANRLFTGLRGAPAAPVTGRQRGLNRLLWLLRADFDTCDVWHIEPNLTTRRGRRRILLDDLFSHRSSLSRPSD